jgi:S-adenosyl methyltransferase
VEGDWRQDATRRDKAAQIDTTLPNPARAVDYVRGGTNNFEADRKAVRAMYAVAPVMRVVVPAEHAFHRRVTRFLVAEAGVRQFLDVGTSFATSGNTHDVAQSMDPRCRVVYVDSDPMVLAHARALLRSTSEGAVGYLDDDVTDSTAIIAGAAATLDLARPVAVMVMAMSTLAYFDDLAVAAMLVTSLLAAMPSGSYLALYHLASDLNPSVPAAVRQWNRASAQPVTLRSHDEVASLVAGLNLVPPGLVPISQWRPEPSDPGFGDVVPVYGVVARKP